MKKRVISILLSAAMISSMVVAGGVTAHAEENVTLNVFDAHAYGLEEYDEMVKAFEEFYKSSISVSEDGSFEIQ